MKNTFEKLMKVLAADQRLVVDGRLAKNKVIELALRLDKQLLKLLLGSDELKAAFFEQVDDVLVFDKVKFQAYISNKQFLPDSFTSYKNKIGLSSADSFLTDSREVVLDFPYKDCILEGGQTKEEAKRQEVFWNETLSFDEIDRLLKPKALVNFVKFSRDGKDEKLKQNKKLTSEDLDIHKDNFLIKGNNLNALHCLSEVLSTQVKLIYIDPPFNTERDSFTYNDSFTHSTWLTFLKNRLVVAKKLLNEKGNIVVHLDNNESHYAKILLDEIFGRENFINEIVWHKGREGGSSRSHAKGSSIPTEYQNILIYAKNKSIRHWNPTLGPYKESTISNIEKDDKGWYYTRGRMGREPSEQEKESGAGLKSYVSDRVDLDKEKIIKLLTAKDAQYVVLGDIWTNEIVKNSKVSGYDTEKPEKLLKLLVESGSDEGDLVLDFFSGSATTAAVCHKLNRRYIAIEQLEEGVSKALERLTNAVKGDEKGISKEVKWKGGRSFIYAELGQANQVFVDRIQQAKNTKELLKIWEDMQEKAFLSYKVRPKDIDSSKNEFEQLSIEDQKRLLIATLDKNMLYVPYCDIDDKSYQISKEVRSLNQKFYGDL